MALPERKDPTHILTITVPLDLNTCLPTEAEIQSAFHQAVTTLLELARVGTLGLLCDAIDVSVRNTMEPPTSDDKSAKEAYWYKWAYEKLGREPGNSIAISDILRKKLP